MRKGWRDFAPCLQKNARPRPRRGLNRNPISGAKYMKRQRNAIQRSEGMSDSDTAKLYAIAEIAYGRSVKGGWDSLDEHEKDRYAEIVEEVLGGGSYNGMAHYEELVHVASEAWDAAMKAMGR